MKFSSASALLALATLIFTTTQGARAGSYSPLDPYADVQAPVKQPKAQKVKAEPRPKRVKDTSPEASFNNQPLSDAQPTEVKPAKVKTAKVKTAKVKTEKLVAAKAQKPPKPPKQVAEKPVKEESLAEASDQEAKAKQSGGFVSGLKEIQSGYMHTFKAAGSGIFNSTKAAGSKVADGTKKVSEGTKSSGGLFNRKKDAAANEVKSADGSANGEASAVAENGNAQPEAMAESKPQKAPKPAKAPKVAKAPKEPKEPKEPKVAKAPKEPKEAKVAKAPKEPKEAKVAKAPKAPKPAKEIKIANAADKPAKKLKMPNFGFGKGKEKENGEQLASQAVSPPSPSEIITPEEAIAHPEKFEKLGKPLGGLNPIKSTPVKLKKQGGGLIGKMNPFSKTAKAPKIEIAQPRATAQGNGSASN